MSPAAWIRKQRDRPIAERERRGALALVLSLLIGMTVLLLLIPPVPPHALARRSPTNGTVATLHTLPGVTTAQPDRARSRTDQRSSSVVVGVTRVFLTGFLAYLYGRAPASQIKDATAALARSLRAHTPRVSPAMRERDPRIVALHTTPVSAGLLGVRALINDGELVDYPIVLLLEEHDRRLLVRGLGGEG